MWEASVVPFLAVAVIAFLYSAVGQAGATGYIAVLTLLGFAPASVRPTALVLNILVAILGVVQFARAGYFRWSLFWPLALLSIPMAFVGGMLIIPTVVLKVLLGVVLLYSAIRFLAQRSEPAEVAPPKLPAALTAGAVIGFLSGITGTGGGVFLTPVVLFRRWAKTRTAAAISIAFILVNSVAGIAGYLWSRQPLAPAAWVLAIAALIGGGAGSYLGSRKLPIRTIHVLLAMVLAIAGGKLLVP